ncbi:hypothetical protein DD600_26730 [Enterobacter cloacae]|nr:hypothetical protein DD600_26730 [Enterobacter cloacae]
MLKFSGYPYLIRGQVKEAARGRRAAVRCGLAAAVAAGSHARTVCYAQGRRAGADAFQASAARGAQAQDAQHPARGLEGLQ